MGVRSAGLGHGSTFFFELPLYGSHTEGALAPEKTKTPRNLSVRNSGCVLFRKSAAIFATDDDEALDGRNFFTNDVQQSTQEPPYVGLDVVSEGRSETSIHRIIDTKPFKFPLSEPQPTLIRFLLVVGTTKSAAVMTNIFMNAFLIVVFCMSITFSSN